LIKGFPVEEAEGSRKRGIDMKPLLALLAGTAIAAGPAGLNHLPLPARPQPGSHRDVSTVERAQAAPVRAMILTFSSGEKGQPPQRFVLLTCNPGGGSHPAAEEACQALEKVHGDPARMREDPDVVCPAIWSPVTVTANGIWDGKYFSYQRTFGNNCRKRSLGGALFDI
jgi:hypothetical protein